ncbi:hypothetical protein ANCDUO_06727 [Ancylostoma duodenale]|uniref:Uncharacterized protein n=1 Tax=Ancylostoma duodenale TaxID=51022 RepID=A0A0C2GNU1_9BILA|nr:hypothetical protein ANCDUO_06727 [Ancylostoma duodenale]
MMLMQIKTNLDRERTRFREKVPSLEARNRQLEMMLINQQELEKALEKTKCRLRACEFYKAVTAGKDENAIDKYVKDDGSVEVGQFLNILRRQLEEARKLQVNLTNELRAERELLRTSKKKETDLKNFVKIPPPENPGPSGIAQPLFSELLDDEDTANASTANVSLQYPSSLDKMYWAVVLLRMRSPRVPKTLRERVVAGSLKARSSGLANVHRAAEKALENLELRSVSATSISMRKPLAKRRIEDSSLNPGLSHLFIKRSKSTEVIDLEE